MSLAADVRTRITSFRDGQRVADNARLCTTGRSSADQVLDVLRRWLHPEDYRYHVDLRTNVMSVMWVLPHMKAFLREQHSLVMWDCTYKYVDLLAHVTHCAHRASNHSHNRPHSLNADGLHLLQVVTTDNVGRMVIVMQAVLRSEDTLSFVQAWDFLSDMTGGLPLLQVLLSVFDGRSSPAHLFTHACRHSSRIGTR